MIRFRVYISNRIRFRVYISNIIRFRVYISNMIRFRVYISNMIRFRVYISNMIRFRVYKSNMIRFKTSSQYVSTTYLVSGYSCIIRFGTYGPIKSYAFYWSKGEIILKALIFHFVTSFLV